MNRFTIKFLIAKHKILWPNKIFALSAMAGFPFFIGSLFINYSAIKYAALEAGNSTTDILLENLPVVNSQGLTKGVENVNIFSLMNLFFPVITK